MLISEMTPTYRPANRLSELGAQRLSNAELLAVLIGWDSAVEIANELVHRYGNLGNVRCASIEELCQLPEVGPAVARRIQAALELGKRAYTERSDEHAQICSPADAAALLMPLIGDAEQEHLVAIILDTRNRVIASEIVYKGSLNSTQLRVGEVFREAIRRNAAGIVIGHNHPSADCSPSSADVAVTKILVEAGRLLDIALHDHIIVGHGRFVSLKERGLGFG